MINKVISGHQTGADEASLDAALFLEIETGGWVPKKAVNERGKICTQTYTTFKETESTGYLVRTKLNVQDSDATLVFSYGVPKTGTLRTIEFCQELGKPYLYIDLKKYKNSKSIIKWLKELKPGVLNVAGSRESKHPGIYMQVRFILIDVFMEINGITT